MSRFVAAAVNMAAVIVAMGVAPLLSLLQPRLQLRITQTLRYVQRHAVQSNFSHARTFAQKHAPTRAVYIYLLQGHDVQS